MFLFSEKNKILEGIKSFYEFKLGFKDAQILIVIMKSS